jgi:hypothetical protein
VVKVIMFIADGLFHFLQLFDSFTTAHEVSGNAPVQLLQAGGSAVEDIQEARAYLDLISSRYVCCP